MAFFGEVDTQLRAHLKPVEDYLLKERVEIDKDALIGIHPKVLSSARKISWVVIESP